MNFDISRYQDKIIAPKKIPDEPAGLMMLYEALLHRIERVGGVTAELSLKLVWYSARDKRPRCTSIHSFASVLNNKELTDFAKIMNCFLPDGEKLTGIVDLKELVTMAVGVVEAINHEEFFVYCYIDNKARIGKKLKRFEVADKKHPMLSREICDGVKDLEWYIPPQYENEKKFKLLSDLNRKRWRSDASSI